MGAYLRGIAATHPGCGFFRYANYFLTVVLVGSTGVLKERSISNTRADRNRVGNLSLRDLLLVLKPAYRHVTDASTRYARARPDI